jgi:pyrroloquinoline-quinone synthase
VAKSEFRRDLETAVQRKHSSVHPWSEAWVSGRLNKKLLGEWTKQHYHFVSHAAEWVATIFANCPHEEVREFLLENVCEEEGVTGQAGYAPVRHPKLLLDFAEHCGMRRAEVVNAQLNGEVLAETLGLQAWCSNQSRRHFTEAIASILIGLESQVPQIYAKTTPPLLEKYGFTEEEVVFFRLHIVADTEHGERGYEIVDRYANTPELQANCLRFVKEATMMRRLYLDGLYHKYLAQPNAQAAE